MELSTVMMTSMSNDIPPSASSGHSGGVDILLIISGTGLGAILLLFLLVLSGPKLLWTEQLRPLCMRVNAFLEGLQPAIVLLYVRLSFVLFLTISMTILNTVSTYLGSLPNPIHHSHKVVGVLDGIAALIALCIAHYQRGYQRNVGINISIVFAWAVGGFRLYEIYEAFSSNNYDPQVFGAAAMFYGTLATIYPFMHQIGVELHGQLPQPNA